MVSVQSGLHELRSIFTEPEDGAGDGSTYHVHRIPAFGRAQAGDAGRRSFNCGAYAVNEQAGGNSSGRSEGCIEQRWTLNR